MRNTEAADFFRQLPKAGRRDAGSSEYRDRSPLKILVAEDEWAEYRICYDSAENSSQNGMASTGGVGESSRCC